jgi:carboxyl-terminal processing protease
VKVAEPKNNRFQDELLSKYAFFNFAQKYGQQHKVTHDSQIDDQTMQAFRQFLTEEKIPFTEQQLNEVSDWAKMNIKSELFVAEFGQQEGLKVRAEADPQVMKGLDLLPQAKSLAENARKIIAERGSANNPVSRSAVAQQQPQQRQ